MKNLIFLFLIGALMACGNTGNTNTDTEEAPAEEAQPEQTTMEEMPKDIVGLAMNTESLSTLVEAVKAAELVETLQGEGPFTVFAPTNEAFAALPEGTLESLLKPENKDQLVKILTYHVVPAKVMSGDLSDGMAAGTVEGSEATITINEGNVMVDGANVVMADVSASNGVVHVIDAVIMPSEK